MFSFSTAFRLSQRLATSTRTLIKKDVTCKSLRPTTQLVVQKVYNSTSSKNGDLPEALGGTVDLKKIKKTRSVKKAAENICMSSSSDWNAFGEQSSSNARQDRESTFVSSSTSSSSSHSTGFLISGTSASDTLSQLILSERSKKRPMTRYERIADLEKDIKNNKAESSDLAKEIKLWEDKLVQQQELEEEKQKKKLLNTLEKGIAEKKGDLERLLAEMHSIK